MNMKSNQWVIAMTELPQRGRGKIQFISALSEIEKLSDGGWPAKSIWETLQKEDRYSASYKTFMYHFGKQIGKRHERKPSIEKPKISTAVPPQKIVSEKTDNNKNAKGPKMVNAFKNDSKSKNMGAVNANKIQDDLI